MSNSLLKPNIIALSGGVGGAKLALGLSRILPSNNLTIVTNTADDFRHLGLFVSPDLDTVMYTLADINNKQQGWGIADESWACMDAINRLQGETWFRLGDQDIATHLLRTQWLNEGKTITQVTEILSQRLGIKHRLLPMCNEVVSTVVKCQHFDKLANMPFQEYFVKYQCQPIVSDFSFVGIESAKLTPEISQAIAEMDMLIICPSNPFVSVAPILAVPGMKSSFLERKIPRVVVSPIIGGKAIKGPAAKMMKELNIPCSALSVAEFYKGFATHFVLDLIDQQFQSEIEQLGFIVILTNTLMHSLDDRIQLANTIVGKSL